MIITKPQSSELTDYYKSYLKYIPETDLLQTMEELSGITAHFLSGISDDDSQTTYAPGKWQVKEVIGHLCDTERILVYRALRFARKDETPLTGFEENDYVKNANFKTRSWSSIREEKRILSEGTLHFFKSLDPQNFDLQGTANGNKVSVRSILFFIIAHERHHLQVIKERYLNH